MEEEAWFTGSPNREVLDAMDEPTSPAESCAFVGGSVGGSVVGAAVVVGSVVGAAVVVASVVGAAVVVTSVVVVAVVVTSVVVAVVAAVEDGSAVVAALVSVTEEDETSLAEGSVSFLFLHPANRVIAIAAIRSAAAAFLYMIK
jgi:hypothetical protein